MILTHRHIIRTYKNFINKTRIKGFVNVRENFSNNYWEIFTRIKNKTNIV